MRTVARVGLKVSTMQRDWHCRVKILKELLNKILFFWFAILYRLLSSSYRRFGLVKASVFRIVNSSFTTIATIPPINFHKFV